MIRLFRAGAEVQRENAELQARWRGGEYSGTGAKPLWFIGTNAAGIVFGLDAAGRVSMFDEIEMEPEPLIRPETPMPALTHAGGAAS